MGPKKRFIQKIEELLEGPHDKAETQCMALRLGKNLAFSKDTCLEKERVPSKMTTRKVGVGLKRKRELNKGVE